jgi:flagellar motor component MotA
MPGTQGFFQTLTTSSKGRTQWIWQQSIGLFSGTGLIPTAVIVGGSAGIFLNVPGILIVVGGALAATCIKFTLSDVLNSVAVAMKAFFFQIGPFGGHHP